MILVDFEDQFLVEGNKRLSALRAEDDAGVAGDVFVGGDGAAGFVQDGPTGKVLLLFLIQVVFFFRVPGPFFKGSSRRNTSRAERP